MPWKLKFPIKKDFTKETKIDAKKMREILKENKNNKCISDNLLLCFYVIF